MTARLEGDDEKLSLHRAAERLGWKGSPQALFKKMKRYLEAKERKSPNVSVVVRGIGTNGRPVYSTTMRLLKRYCREFFVRTVDELAVDLREYITTHEDGLEARLNTNFGQKLEELNAVCDELFEQLLAMKTRVDELELKIATSRT